MKEVKKYRVTNLTTGKVLVYDTKDFILKYPETWRLMDENAISTLTRDGDKNKTGFMYEEFFEELPTCQRCGAVALVVVVGKTSDGCFMKHLHREYDGYVLRDMGVGEGDYLEFGFCVNCGQIQGEFPRRIHGALVTRETKGYPYE